MVALFFERSIRVGIMFLLLNPIVVPQCLAYIWNSINISWFIFTADLPRFRATMEKQLWEFPVCLQKDKEGIFTLNVGGIIAYDGFPEVITGKRAEEPHHSLPASLFQKLCNELPHALLSCVHLWWFTFKLLPKINPPLPEWLLPGIFPQWREKWHIYWTH